MLCLAREDLFSSSQVQVVPCEQLHVNHVSRDFGLCALDAAIFDSLLFSLPRPRTFQRPFNGFLGSRFDETRDPGNRVSPEIIIFSGFLEAFEMMIIRSRAIVV